MNTFVLPDGQAVCIRPLGPGDRSRLVAGLAAVSAQSLYHRFLGPVLREGIALDWLDDPGGGFALGACTATGEPLGVMRWRQSASGEAELAALVVDAWQRRGVGTLLGQQLIEVAATRGITRLHSSLFRENRAAFALLGKLGGVRVLDYEWSVAEVTLELGVPSEH